MSNKVHEKGNRYHQLTETQKALKRQNARHRVRVAHVFGFLANSMKAMDIRTIGYVKATAKIGLANLTYNMVRCVQLQWFTTCLSGDNYAQCDQNLGILDSNLSKNDHWCRSIWLNRAPLPREYFKSPFCRSAQFQFDYKDAVIRMAISNLKAYCVPDECSGKKVNIFF
jgi:hypothetical protein